MKKVIQVVDSYEYVTTNCYQHQLLSDTRKNFDHTLITLNELPNSLPEDATILCTIKIRNVYKHIDRLANVFKNKNILIYDQDPWESFTDIATYPNGYHNVIARMPNVEFINTSKWWTDYVINKGFKSHFCRIWILPEYCSTGFTFEKRESGLCFRGSLHTDRKLAVEKMKELGCTVRTLPGTSNYMEWLKWLQTQRAFFYDETAGWPINGVIGSKHVPKPKNVEIISQGCFIFHDATCKSEDESYGLTNVPCDITYESYEHCLELFNEFNKKSPEFMNELIKESVEKIKQVDGWIDMRKILISHVPRTC